MKEKIKAIWVKQKKPIMVILAGAALALGVPSWLSTPATSITYSGVCTAFEIECE